MKRSTAMRALVAAFVFAAFIWTLVLSVSPQLHERIHSDANRADHSCAVTFVASGNFNHSAPPLLINGPAVEFEFRKFPALHSTSVASPFLLARIFEHAPPAHS